MFPDTYQTSTLSDIRSVILRSTQSLSPVLWASARRSLVIAFQTRLLSWGLSVFDSTGNKHKQCRKKTVFISSTLICSAFFFTSTDLYQYYAHARASSFASPLSFCSFWQPAASPTAAASSTHFSLHQKTKNKYYQKVNKKLVFLMQYLSKK